jgi:hypothetical protein
LPQALQQPAQARAQVLLGIFNYLGKVLAEDVWALPRR